MGFLTELSHSISGTNSGNAEDFQGQATTVQQPTTADQAQQAAQQVQGGLAQQQSFANAVGAQNGLANQSNVYNQLQGVANGTGPNPAQAMLSQSTGQNVANQAALMAGQRGSGANAGLIARQAAQQGAATQQQAAGQAATMQANQSLGALNQLGGIAGQQVGQQQGALNSLNSAQQASQANLLNSINAQNAANVGMQSNINSVNAGIAGANIAGNQALTSGALSGGGSLLSLAKGGMVRKNYDDGGFVSSSVSGDSAPDEDSGAIGGGYSQPKNNGSGAAAAGKLIALLADGGPVPNPYASFTPSTVQAGSIALSSPAAITGVGGAPSSNNGMKNLIGGLKGGGEDTEEEGDDSSGGDDSGGDDSGGGESDARGGLVGRNKSSAEVHPAVKNGLLMMTDHSNNPFLTSHMKMYQDAGKRSETHSYFSRGGKVPAMVSAKEIYLSPKKVQEVAKGKDPIKIGEKIKGREVVKGNSLQNDIIPKDLKEGGVVLPKTVTQAKHPHWEAMKFVRDVIMKGKK